MSELDRGPLYETGTKNTVATGKNHFQQENLFKLCFSSACCQQNSELFELLHNENESKIFKINQNSHI